MLSTQRVSAPMLPVDVCLNVLGVLPVDEVKQVLDAILAMLAQDELTTLLGDLLRRYMAFDNFDLQEFIPEDFGAQLMSAVTRLHTEKCENLVYMLCVWLVSTWQKQDLGGVLLSEIMGKSMTLPDAAVYEDVNEPEPESTEVQKAPESTDEVPRLDGDATITPIHITVVKKKRGRKPKHKGDKEVMIHVKKEHPAESETEQPPENTDGIRRSVRKNKGKNPHLEEMKDSEADHEVVEDSDEEWKDNEKPNAEKVEITNTPVRRRRRAKHTLSTIERIKKVGLPCNVCDFVSKNYLEYNKHVSTHENEPWPRCDKCKKLKLFLNEEKLAEHVKNKHGPFICEKCDRTFASKQTLMKHGIMHGDAPQFQCSYCEKGFSNHYSLQLHENVHHKGIKPFLCTQCGNGFTSKASLEEHMNMHTGVKPFECKICDIKFARKSTLRLHNINEHNEKTKNVRCPTCGKTYRNVYILNAHMKLHDRPKEKPQNNPACEFCGRQFKGKWELQKHIKIVHLKIKDFKCEICGKLFATRVHLQEHTATHTRQAQFFCDICGQGFIHRVTLKAHVFRHKGEKQCQCPICHKRFDVPRFLMRHIKDVHKNVPIPELPKYDVPRSHLAGHLRNRGKYAKKIEPPEVVPRGCEKIRPQSEKPKKEPEEAPIPEQIQVVDVDMDMSMYEVLAPEVVQNMQVIDESKLEEQPQIVQILDDIVDLNGAEGEAQELTILQDAVDADNVMYNTVIVDQDGMIKQEGTNQVQEVIDGSEMRVLQLEIDGEMNTVPIPSDTEYVQWEDKIIHIQEISG